MTSKMIRPLGSIEQFVDCYTAEHLQLQICLKRQSEIPEKGWSINPFNWFTTPTPVPKPEFWSLQAEEMKIPIQFITAKNCDWMSVLEDVLQINFEEGKLLWRAYWVENVTDTVNQGTLVINIHPSLSDTKGLFLFVNDALGHMDRILTGQPDRTVTPKMHLNVEETVDTGDKMTFMEKMDMCKHMIMCSLPWKSPYLKVNPTPLVPDYASRLIQINVPLELSDQILKTVKAKGVSLHAVWTSAAGIAMHEMLNLTTKTKFCSSHEADLRVITKNYDSNKCRIYGTFCNYVENTFEVSKVKSEEEFWVFVYTIHESLLNKLQSDKLVKMMKWCGEFGDLYAMFATLGSTRTLRNEYAVAVHDNVDLFIDDRDAIEIENLCSSVAAHNMGSPFHHTVHVFREKIYYYIYHYPNYANIEKTKEFAYKTLDVLKNKCGQDD